MGADKLFENTPNAPKFKVKDCIKCVVVRILKFEILQITLNKEYQTLSFQFFINKSNIIMFFHCFITWFARFGPSFLYLADFKTGNKREKVVKYLEIFIIPLMFENQL